ncbi:hypothetical protein PSACC_00528 [Paramicrosporidium saccamoebae]|uniref:Uncharacterized protein n=1 Tax=Paramicrosporidium saccamoebae TaxID=1246581 RepID=A0A2H9TPG6_9FUNG|nr:hypothetical protein PSACC_00528 [Paramicrosporidium saccamoebae]
MQSQDTTPGLVAEFSMQLRILLALTAVASASTKLFEYNGSGDLTAPLEEQFRYLDSLYDEDTGKRIPQARNGVMCRTAEGLVVGCSPSQSTFSPSIPGAQFVLGARPLFPVQPGSLAIEVASSVHIYGVENHPFGDKVKDPHTDTRLACSTIAVIASGRMFFSFTFTNEMIYASVLKGSTKSAPSALQYLIPLIATKAGVMHKVKFIFNDDLKRIDWLVDEQSLFSWQQDTVIDKKYLIEQIGEDAVLKFPTNEVVVATGIFTFWNDFLPLEGEPKEHTAVLDPATPEPNFCLSEQAQNAAKSIFKDWSPEVILTIKNITVTREY